MAAIITLLVTVTVSLLITRVGAVALALTGLSQEVAKFQARSAFTGCGFTTTESESVVNHPVRRKIMLVLMLFGNLGLVAIIASTLASFTGQPPKSDTKTGEIAVWLMRFAVLILGLALMWAFFTSTYIDKVISRGIEGALLKWTKLDVRDYVALLHLASGYVVLELQVNAGDWISGKKLSECRLSDEGVLVLGVSRSTGQYVGSPNGNTKIMDGDVLSVYGPIDRLEELDIRKQGYLGDRAHRIAVKVQEEMQKDVGDADDDKPKETT